jgi:hypothetical protein
MKFNFRICDWTRDVILGSWKFGGLQYADTSNVENVEKMWNEEKTSPIYRYIKKIAALFFVVPVIVVHRK